MKQKSNDKPVRLEIARLKRDLAPDKSGEFDLLRDKGNKRLLSVCSSGYEELLIGIFVTHPDEYVDMDDDCREALEDNWDAFMNELIEGTQLRRYSSEQLDGETVFSAEFDEPFERMESVWADLSTICTRFASASIAKK